MIEELSAANETNNNVPDGYRTLNIARQMQQHDAAVMNELAILKEELKSVKQENRDMFWQLTERHRGNDRFLKRLAHFALGHKYKLYQQEKPQHTRMHILQTQTTIYL